MDKGSISYDTDLQMFVEKPREIDLSRLRFLRWLSENGRLEHSPSGEADGEYALCSGPHPPAA